MRKRTPRALLDLVGATAQTAGASSGDQTDLATRRTEAVLRRRVTNVLVVTTTVRVLDGVHGDTAHLRPRVTLGLVLVPRATCLQHWLVDAAAAGNDADRAWSAEKTRMERSECGRKQTGKRKEKKKKNAFTIRRGREMETEWKIGNYQSYGCTPGHGSNEPSQNEGYRQVHRIYECLPKQVCLRRHARQIYGIK